jgi:hypothetical protein
LEGIQELWDPGAAAQCQYLPLLLIEHLREEQNVSYRGRECTCLSTTFQETTNNRYFPNIFQTSVFTD